MLCFAGKPVDIYIQHGAIIIRREDNTLIVQLRYLLTVKQDGDLLEIHCVVKKKNSNLKVKTIPISGPTEEILVLNEKLQNVLEGRPKRLLVMINPKSGTQKAVKVFENIALPLFNLCGVQATIKVTTRPKEPIDILKSFDLSQIDGLVAVGGDGLYCECMNGLVTRLQKDRNIDYDSHDIDIEPASLPIGIIPAGSGDVIVQYLHGTKCVTTAVLHILLGGHVDSNVVSVHEGGQLLSYSALILGFGLFGDMMYDCERLRSLGPLRYKFVPFRSLLKRKEYDVEIEYYHVNKDQPPKRARVFGKQISLPNGLLTSSKKKVKIQRTWSTSGVSNEINAEECKKEKGRVYAVDTHAIMMKEQCGKMTPRFGQDSLMVYTTHTCPLPDHISQLTKVKNEQPNCYDFKFVTKHEVSRYKVRMIDISTVGKSKKLQKEYYLNCDGEVIKLKESEFDVKLHRRAVKFFGDIMK